MSSDKALDREADTPLHQQLYEHLRAQIDSGVLAPGARLPTETALGSSFAVSRGTVRQALEELGRSGLIERSPRRGTFVRGRTAVSSSPNRFVSVILPYGDGHEAFFMDIMRGVRAACRSRGVEVTFGYSHEQLEAEKRELERLQRGGSLGVAIFPNDPEKIVPFLLEQRLPFVLLDRYRRGTDVDFVGIDNVAGAYRATEHLILLGHKQIAFVHYNETGLEMDLSTVQDRWQGYRQALYDYNLTYKPGWFYGGKAFSGDDEALAYVDFFRLPDRPTAAFVVNDRTAIFFLRAAKLSQVLVPQEFALVGFDDLPVASQLSVALTTIKQPRFDLGFKAAHLLLDRIGGVSREPVQLLLPTELKIRESCGARLKSQATPLGIS